MGLISASIVEGLVHSFIRGSDEVHFVFKNILLRLGFHSTHFLIP